MSLFGTIWSSGIPGSQPPMEYEPNWTASVPVKSSIGEMSSMVSRSPSLRNHSNDERWMSMRSGTSSTFPRRENERRTRAALTLLKSRGLLDEHGGHGGRTRAADVDRAGRGSA